MELENTENVENTSNNEEENKVKTDKKQHFNKQSNDKDASSRKKFFKKKICYFCKNNIDVLDYKDIKLLKNCSKHQRLVTKAIKRARNIALLPYETKY